jgi:hypothetical protein
VRCSLGAAVFIRSDETTVPENELVLDAFPRLRLQIGGANIAAAIALGSRRLRRRSQRKERLRSLLLSAAARDPI